MLMVLPYNRGGVCVWLLCLTSPSPLPISDYRFVGVPLLCKVKLTERNNFVHLQQIRIGCLKGRSNPGADASCAYFYDLSELVKPWPMERDPPFNRTEQYGEPMVMSSVIAIVSNIKGDDRADNNCKCECVVSRLFHGVVSLAYSCIPLDNNTYENRICRCSSGATLGSINKTALYRCNF